MVAAHRISDELTHRRDLQLLLFDTLLIQLINQQLTANNVLGTVTQSLRLLALADVTTCTA